MSQGNSQQGCEQRQLAVKGRGDEDAGNLMCGGEEESDPCGDCSAANMSAGKKLSSRYRGVCWNKKNKRWQAAINSSGRYLYLGSFVSEEDAARAFDRAAIRIRGRKARINFKFDDYLEELQMHSRSQTSDLASDGTNEVLLRPQILGPTITSNVHMSFPMMENSNTPHRGQYDSLDSITQHSIHAERRQQVPVMNGIPLQRENLGMSSTRVSNVCGPNADALLGRVVHRTIRSSPHLASNAWMEARKEQMSAHARNHPWVSQMDQSQQHMYMDTSSNQQPTDERQQAPPSHYDPKLKPQNYQGSGWDQQGLSATPAPQPNPVDDPMSTIPKDCHIVKIIPSVSGVFAVLYARPGHSSTGVVIWDGHAVHNMGMFTTRADAQQACKTTCDIVVKLIKQYSGEQPPTNAQPVELGPGFHSQASPGEPSDPQASPPQGPPAVLVHEAPERQAPLTSPFVPENSGSLFRLISIPSEDFGKYFNASQFPVEPPSYCKADPSPADAVQKPTNNVGGQRSLHRPVVDLVNENKGNLGSLMNYDSWSSSILGLISLSVPKGAGAENRDKVTTVTAEFRRDNSFGAVGGICQTSLSELKSAKACQEAHMELLSAARKNGSTHRDKLQPRTSPLAPEMLKIETDTDAQRTPQPGNSDSREDVKNFPSSSSVARINLSKGEALCHSRESGSYSNVVDIIVSRDRGNRRKTGILAQSRAPGETLEENRAENGRDGQVHLKRRNGDCQAEEEGKHIPAMKRVRVSEIDRIA